MGDLDASTLDSRRAHRRDRHRPRRSGPGGGRRARRRADRRHPRDDPEHLLRRRRARPAYRHRSAIGRPAAPRRSPRSRTSSRASGADIVGIEEGEHNAGVIAAGAGLVRERSDAGDLALPDRRPARRRTALYVWVEVLPGRFVAIGNVHLPSDPYGPYAIRDGATLAEVLALETSVRLPAIQAQLAALPPLAASGMPTFLTGDFNSPSHLDWTAAVSAVRPEVPYPVDWPVSQALADAGFRDSYREVHPDPRRRAGLHLDARRAGERPARGPRPHRLGARERAGDRRSTARSSARPAGPDVGIGVRPWPTDHRGVVSTFASRRRSRRPSWRRRRRRVFVGDTPRRSIPGGGRDRAVGRDRPGRTGRRRRPSRACPSGRRRRSDGTATFATAALAPGAYDAILVVGRRRRLARRRSGSTRRDADDGVDVEERRTSVGEPIEVSWRAAPGLPLGLARPSTRRATRRRARTAPAATPAARATAGTCCTSTRRPRSRARRRSTPTSVAGSATWPLKPGTYEIRFLVDDSYRSIAASANFKIVKP